MQDVQGNNDLQDGMQEQRFLMDSLNSPVYKEESFMETQEIVLDSLKQTLGNVHRRDHETQEQDGREEDVVLIEDVPLDESGQEKQDGEIMREFQSLSDHEED